MSLAVVEGTDVGGNSELCSFCFPISAMPPTTTEKWIRDRVGLTNPEQMGAEPGLFRAAARARLPLHFFCRVALAGYGSY